MTRPTTTPAERLLAAREQASRELKWPVTDPRVQALAALIIAHEQVQVRMLAGHTFAVSDLLALNAALKEARAQNPNALLPIEGIQMEICKTITGICPACNAHIPGYADYEPLDEPDPLPPGNVRFWG
jgi:hypothetical protein